MNAPRNSKSSGLLVASVASSVNRSALLLQVFL